MRKLAWAFVSNLRAVLLNFNQTSFLMFETTWQIPCATCRCVARKNSILKPLSFTKICTNLAHFDIPAFITLHTYNLSICDRRQHVHRGLSCPANFVWREVPVVIWTSAIPRCFRGFSISCLPVKYYDQKNAWMSGEILVSYLTTFNLKNKSQRRSVLLLHDNASCHPPD